MWIRHKLWTLLDGTLTYRLHLICHFNMIHFQMISDPHLLLHMFKVLSNTLKMGLETIWFVLRFAQIYSILYCHYVIVILTCAIPLYTLYHWKVAYSIMECFITSPVTNNKFICLHQVSITLSTSMIGVVKGIGTRWKGHKDRFKINSIFITYIHLAFHAPVKSNCKFTRIQLVSIH
jgi:hypothetical protein